METSDAAEFMLEWQIGTLVDSLDIVNSFCPSSYISDPNSSPESKMYLSDQDLIKNDDSNRGSKNYSYGHKGGIPTSFEDPISHNSLGYCEAVKRSTTQYHVLAERKWRQKLSKKFLTLSTMIPGLKKLDKASILGGTIDYIKQQEERLRTLEQEQKKRKHEELDFSACAKRIHVPSTNDTSSLDQNLAEIEVRIHSRSLLIRVCCKKSPGIIKEILSEVEKFDHLYIISSSAMPFGDTTLHMSVLAEMNEEFRMAVEGLAENIIQAIVKLI